MSKRWLIDSVGTVTIPELEGIGIDNQLSEEDLLIASRTQNTTNKVTLEQLRESILKDGMVSGSAIQENTIAENHIINRSITGDKLVDGTIDSIKLANSAVKTDNIQDGAVTNIKLADGIITSDKLASGEDPAVSQNNIKNGAITNVKLADGAITANKIADKVITSEQISDQLFQAINNNNTSFALDDIDKTVTLSYIRNVDSDISTDQITTNQIADGAITNTKLANITNNGFAPVGTDNIQNEAITSNKIANGAITNAKLSLIDTQQGAAVGRNNIQNNAINEDKIADSAITENKIANSAITLNKIADSTITTSKIDLNNFIIGTDNIQNGAINVDKIEDGAILEDKIANDAVTTNKIADGAVTSNKLDKVYLSKTNQEYPVLLGNCWNEAATVNKSLLIWNYPLDLTEDLRPCILTYFRNSNTATDPTLNVNQTGAKPIMRYGTTPVGTTPETSWQAGSFKLLTYSDKDIATGAWVLVG